MTNRIIPFDFESHAVRAVIADDRGEPWFIAKEVAAALGYSDAEAMTRRLDDDEKQNLQIVGFGPRGVTVINESGLYSSILGSNKPEAKRFKRWVTAEVLPSIRTSGAYAEPKAVQMLDTIALFKPFFEVATLIGCDKQAAAISANQAVQAVSGANVLQLMGRTHIEGENQESTYYTPTELGKQLGTSAQQVNRMLVQAGLQSKPGEHWEPTEAGKKYSRIFDTGKKHGSGVPIQQVKWAATVVQALSKSAA